MSPRNGKGGKGSAPRQHPLADRTAVPIPPVPGIVHLASSFHSNSGSEFGCIYAPCWRAVTRSCGQWFLCGFHSKSSRVPFINVPPGQVALWVACPEPPTFDSCLMPFPPAFGEELEALEDEASRAEEASRPAIQDGSGEIEAEEGEAAGDDVDGEASETRVAPGSPSFSPSAAADAIRSRGSLAYGDLKRAVMEDCGCSQRKAEDLIARANESGLIGKIGQVYMWKTSPSNPTTL